MKFTIPIYMEKQSRGPSGAPLFTARALYAESPVARGEKLSQVLQKLQSELQTLLENASTELRHDGLVTWCHLVDYRSKVLDLRLELKSTSLQRRFFMLGYESLGRQLWFTPRIPQLHFEVLPAERINERATEVYTKFFRQLAKKEQDVDLDGYALPAGCDASLTVLELKVKLACIGVPPKQTKRDTMFGEGKEQLNGENELRKVGRLLNSLYPDNLPRAIGRDTEVSQLERWLLLQEPRAILLVGPRQVGKTAIVQEMVWRMRAMASGKKHRALWLVSPMRLISGMSLVGQWQQRVHAICDHLERSGGVLFLDDLLGLFTAGKSSNSALGVAELLKPRLQRRSLRVVAEITPESWRVLRERDRAFADLFQVLPIPEPSEAETLRILVSAAREFEQQHHCEFDLEVVPTVYQLHRRFASDAAFPGKAASFLQRLAVKNADSSCGRAAVLTEFQERSGVQLALLDQSQTLDREGILKDLRSQVSGQDEVLHAFADVLLKLKARLNDPKRPLAAFLLLGPTGVGKTQCAKALAAHLFGSPERLLRFDMNEMADSSAVLRLTGTVSQPDGLLTGAVRRQPFSVVLFDEIEKAAPEVFDMLLGVLDEGRLSDSFGRVADFTSTVILLTSNLGVKESTSRVGFNQAQAHEMEAAFIKAAETFFRPEFFNRLDRVLPFRELQREHLAHIAQRLLAGVLQRDGLRQRRCLFACSQAATEALIELGYHPQLGARALKRVVEREVAQPLAAELAAHAPGIPLRFELSWQAGQFTLRSQELKPVLRHIFWPQSLSAGAVSAAAVVTSVFEVLDQVVASLEEHAPAGIVELSSLTPPQERYYHCREQVRRVERLLETVEEELKAEPVRRSRAMSVSRAKPSKIILRQWVSGSPRFDRMREAEHLDTELAQAEVEENQDLADTSLFACVRELTLLTLLAAEPYEDEAVGVIIRGQGPCATDHAATFQSLMRTFLEECSGMAVQLVGALVDYVQPFQVGFWCRGPNAARLLQPFLGEWLLHDDAGVLHTLQVGLQPCSSPQELTRRLSTPTVPAEGATALPVVVSAYSDHWLCHHTDLALPRAAGKNVFRAFYLAALPPPQELATLLLP